MTNDGRNKDDPTLVLAASKDDIISLWEDEAIRGVLKKRGVRLEDSPGFFLDDTARIATVDYEPIEGMSYSRISYYSSPSCPLIEDIVRARLRTFGVEEHRFTQENGA